MISAINSYNSSIQSRAYSPQFTGISRFSPLSIYMDKAFDRFVKISKFRRPPIDPVFEKNAEFIRLKIGRNVAEVLDLNPNNSKEYVIFYHGLGQNILSNQELYKTMIAKGYGVIAPEYSGFGNSDGKLTSRMVRKNTKAVLKFLNSKGVENKNIGVVGYSMGSFPAIDMAYKNNDFKFLVLISPFNSMYSQSKVLTKGNTVTLPKFWKCLIDKAPVLLKQLDVMFKNKKKMRKISVPTYFVQSYNDKIVSLDSTKELARCSTNLKEFVSLENGGHHMEQSKINAFLNLGF